MILEAYYEPRFKDSSFGFRPGRGCHNALVRIANTWTGTTWFIEGDISKCFDKIDHSILLQILGNDIKDGRFLNLIKQMLQAGYMENWKLNQTLSGTPQGGVISPLLSNIYLHLFDVWVEEKLLPAYNRGESRRSNKTYKTLEQKIRKARAAGEWGKVKEMTAEMRSMPSQAINDPGYRRLKYVRYADDFLLGFMGPRNEAGDIRDKIQWFLANKLNLELSMDKTLITHSRTEKANFLGYQICVMDNDTKIKSGKRCINGKVALLMPRAVVTRIRDKYCKEGRILHKAELRNDTDFTIVNRFGLVLRGLYNYYRQAMNVSKEMGTIHWVLKTSCLKTLANKYLTTVNAILPKYRRIIDGHEALQVVVQRKGKNPLVANFGGFSLGYQKHLFAVDCDLDNAWLRHHSQRSEIVQRLLADCCELCGAKDVPVEVHHIRKLANLQRPGQAEMPAWKRIMIARKRKTLVVCEKCHDDIHHGNYDGPSLQDASLESRMR
jgi:group II intron reverse transcriptase/maturase